MTSTTLIGTASRRTELARNAATHSPGPWRERALHQLQLVSVVVILGLALLALVTHVRAQLRSGDVYEPSPTLAPR